MSLKNAVSVRFEKDTYERLQAVAERSGLTPADLIRKATEGYLVEIEEAGQIVIPLRKVAEGKRPYNAKKNTD